MLMKMRSKMQRTNNQKGFTLVELMVVVVIIGILVAIAIPVYSNITAKANRSAVEANLRTIDGAIMMYKADQNITTDPSDVAALTPSYLAEEPEGPDNVAYSISSGRAVVNGDNAGDWFTASATVNTGGFSLPITWD